MLSAEHPPTVLHLITSLEIGGTELAVVRLSSGLRRYGLASVIVALSRPDRVPQIFFADARLPVLCLESRKPASLPRAIGRLARLVRTFRPSIIHSWMYHTHCLSVAALAAAPRAPLVWSVRSSAGPDVAHPMSTRAARRGAAWLSRLPHAIIFNSQVALDSHRRIGFRTGRGSIIHNGVDSEGFKPDPEAFRNVRHRLGIGADEVLVGFVARFHPVKDHLSLLKAIALLRHAGWPVRAILVGRGTDGDEAAALVRSLGLSDWVIALGERGDVSTLTAALDIAVCASTSEGSSNTLAEAMACGIPCVATDVGNAREALDGCGLIVPPSDPDRLANSLKEIIAMSSSEREQFGVRARRRAVECYSLHRSVDAYWDLYRSLLRGGPAYGREGGPAPC